MKKNNNVKPPISQEEDAANKEALQKQGLDRVANSLQSSRVSKEKAKKVAERLLR
jgi:CRISPR/Cas system-associated endoribonuclease Cas2